MSVKAVRRLRLGMVGGGQGAFIGPVHRMAARIDDRYDFVAGALSRDAQRSRASGEALGLPADRIYDDFKAMAAAEQKRSDPIDVVAIVTPNNIHHAAARAFLEAGIHVICDKPMTTTAADAEDLVGIVKRTGLTFTVTYNYSGYPMVRQARTLVEAGEIGELRLVQVEYPQEWLVERIEASGHKQAAWRTDPSRAGPGGSLSDIGTHAFHLVEFVTGHKVGELAADLARFVPARALDDNVNMMMRFASGARGMLWASQVAPGNDNALRLRVFGSKGSVEWRQEEPNQLRLARLGQPARILGRAAAGLSGPVGAHGGRLPAGHTEGYLEAFANLYADAASLIGARLGGPPASAGAKLLPNVADGARGVRFVMAAVESTLNNSAWISLGN